MKPMTKAQLSKCNLYVTIEFKVMKIGYYYSPPRLNQHNFGAVQIIYSFQTKTSINNTNTFSLIMLTNSTDHNPPEKLIVTHLVMTFPASYSTRSSSPYTQKPAT